MEKINYFELWLEDKKSIINTMYKNYSADVKVHGVNSGIAKNQLELIQEYEEKFYNEYFKIDTMEEKKQQSYCKIDLIKRGAIEL